MKPLAYTTALPNLASTSQGSMKANINVFKLNSYVASVDTVVLQF